MTKKLRAQEKIKPKKKIVSVVEEDDLDEGEDEKYSDNSFKELDPSDIHAGYDTSVQDWLLRNGLRKKDYVLRVYRFGGAGDNERTAVGKYIDHIPDEDEIGLKYGSGRYECILQVSDKDGQRRVTSSRFLVDSIYDEIRQEEKIKKAQQMQQLPVPINGTHQFDNMIESMSKFMAVIFPLINAGRANIETPDVSAIMMKNYENMNSVIKRSILDNQQLINDVQRGNMGLPETMEDLKETTGLMGLITTIGPLIEKVLPLILGGGAKPKIAATLIKSAPQYAQVIKDKKLLHGLIQWIEKKHGKEVSGKLLASLKLKRPRIPKAQ